MRYYIHGLSNRAHLHTGASNMISEDFAKNKAAELLTMAYTKHLGYKKLSEDLTDSERRRYFSNMAADALEHYRSMREMATITTLLSWEEASMEFELS